MRIRMAEHYGMCFGVRDAIGMAMGLAKSGPITILGDLVHNAQVVSEMESAGAVRAGKAGQVRTPIVLLTAHGTSDRVKEQLRERGHQIHDAACPLVTRVHQAIRKLVDEGRHPVIIGQEGHVEVRGLTEDLTECSVVLTPDDLNQLQGRERLGVVAQTTQPLAHVLSLVAAIRERFPKVDLRFIDTVCQPTKDRQESLQRLAAECDVIVVVGGPDSNNSRKLTELARKMGRAAHQVAKAEELKREWFDDAHLVGVTAGTSTPEPIITEVRKRLESWVTAA